MAELARLRSEGLIAHLGVTNFDTDHLRLLVKHGIPVATNQVSFSLLDRRAAGRMSEFCRASGVRLLAYGTLAGGFLSEQWLGKPEPKHLADWSKSKYKRFIDAACGWDVLQGILSAAKAVATKHRVSISNVAVRWVLEHEAVGAVIVGARLGEREHRADNLVTFSFALDAEDRTRLDEALARTREIPGDCGDEYRHPPYLTASGDLSHHLDVFAPAWEPVVERPGRSRVDSGSQWERIAGYCRAVRTGDRIHVSGTTATHGESTVICPGDAEAQTVYVLDKIAASLEALGGRLEDVVRTRVYVRDATRWEPVARVHGRYFGAIRPVNTLLEVSRLVGPYEIEVEAEAEVGEGQ
jgi:enamine deaminase RidA (YjgF/YER057c/UK114 family)